MHVKTCPICGGKSYSAAAMSPWICPYCENDITEVEICVAVSQKEKLCK